MREIAEGLLFSVLASCMLTLAEPERRSSNVPLATTGFSIWPKRLSREFVPGFSFPGTVGGAMGVSMRSHAELGWEVVQSR